MPALNESPARISGPQVRLHLTGTGAPPVPGVLLGIERGKIHMRVDKWVEPATSVSAVLARLHIFGEVAYCTRKDNWYRLCMQMVVNEQGRRDPRLPVRQTGTVIALSDNGSASTSGMLLDVSVSGMRVEVEHEVEQGSMLFLETESTVMVGEVRHCRRGRNGYEAGVEITDILSAVESAEKSPGVLRNIRRKVAEAILGEPIGKEN